MSQVEQFLSGRCVFVTGFTGFLGKLLVAKLLTSCPNINRIYILMRKNGHPSVLDRLTHILQSKVFDKLKEKEPTLLTNKLVVVEGDLNHPDLGLIAEDKQAIIKDVSVVFHLAQISKCDSHLREAIEANVYGTKNLLTLSKKMVDVVSIVHLSTLYSCCNHPTIAEIIYQPALQPQKLLNASEWVSDDVFRDIENFLTKGHANAYTYTKALAEYLIQEEFSSLPISVVRPAIIGSTWREPFPDWIDSPNGLAPILLACGKGQLRVLKGNSESTAEVIPADTVINTLIAASWYQSVGKADTRQDNSILLYNLTSNAGRRLTWQTLEAVACSSFRKNPLNNVLRIPQASITKHSLVYNFKGTCLHVLPAYIADVINLLLGRSPHYVNTNRQFLKLLHSVEYFTSREWKIDTNNLKELMSKLSSADKKVFAIDTSCAHWPSYIEGLCLGIKQYVAREPLSSLPTARKSINRIRWADRFWMCILALAFIRLASTRVMWARKLWNLILSASIYIYARIPKFAKA